MIKVSVMYPYQEGARFDHDYYRDQHMPLVQSLMGEVCKRYAVDKGIGGGIPGSAPMFEAACHIYCESVQAFQDAIGPHSAVIQADIINYTDLTPDIQISEVRIG